MSENIHRLEGRIMKRKKKEKKHLQPTASGSSAPKKSLSDALGISPEVLQNEPKIVITGDYLIEISNHKGIVDLSEDSIKVNTRKFVYHIRGTNLLIANMTDEELCVFGNMISVEKL